MGNKAARERAAANRALKEAETDSARRSAVEVGRVFPHQFAHRHNILKATIRVAFEAGSITASSTPEPWQRTSLPRVWWDLSAPALWALQLAGEKPPPIEPAGVEGQQLPERFSQGQPLASLSNTKFVLAALSQSGVSRLLMPPLLKLIAEYGCGHVYYSTGRDENKVDLIFYNPNNPCLQMRTRLASAQRRRWGMADDKKDADKPSEKADIAVPEYLFHPRTDRWHHSNFGATPPSKSESDVFRWKPATVVDIRGDFLCCSIEVQTCRSLVSNLRV